MNGGFYISQVQVTGPEKKDAIIEFSKGLNVVSGPSDTGKSYLLQCINYMMGGSTPPKDIEEAEGYDCIWMEIHTYYGESFTIKRKMGNSQLLLIGAELPEAKTSTIVQTLSSTHSSTKESNISAFLLKLTNLRDKQIKESKYKKRLIRFSDVKTICLKDESEIITENSPISTGQYSLAPVEESLFNLFLSGEDDEDLAILKDPKVYKSMLRGKLELTQSLLQAERERIVNLKSSVSRMSQQEISIKIDELSLSMGESNQLIKYQENKRNGMLRNLSAVNQHITHLNEIIERFSLLYEHYYSDLQRLEFMLEGEHLLSQLPTVPCPTCGSEVESDKIKDILEDDNREIVNSINKERMKIITKMEDLHTTTEDIQKELSKYNQDKGEIQKDLDLISDLLDKKLRQTRQILSKDLNEFVTLKQNIVLLQDAEINSQHYSREIESYERKINEKPKKEERRILPEEHYQKFCDRIQEQLISWGVNVGNLQFDKNKMDFIINGKARRNYGKGYRAILCSAFLISLMKYCWEQGTYHPRFLVLDSPLTTYREGDKPQEKDEVETTVQNEFFNNLADLSQNFQIIIFDNKDPLLDIQNKITYHHFTRNLEIGRYGFFPMKT